MDYEADLNEAVNILHPLAAQTGVQEECGRRGIRITGTSGQKFIIYCPCTHVRFWTLYHSKGRIEGWVGLRLMETSHAYQNLVGRVIVHDILE